MRKWHAITIILTVIAIACAALVILRGMPPHRIIMATGLEGGSYYEVGQRYRAALALEIVQVELRLTSGSAENLALLLDPDSGVSVAVVPSGIALAGSVSELSALGTIFNEPLWWFQRRDVEGVLLNVRHDKRADRAVIAVVSNTHMAMMILTGLDLLTPEQVACWNVKPAGNCLHQLIAGHGKAIQIAAAGYWVP